jgi:hypothetical protein
MRKELSPIVEKYKEENEKVRERQNGMAEERKTENL